MKDHPNYHPVEIKKDAHRDAFVNVSYSTAWGAKEKAISDINSSFEDGYAKLSQFCIDLLKANPGSIIVLDRTTDNYFKCLFICYAASVKGFGCRPVLGLDRMHLKAKYLDTCLQL